MDLAGAEERIRKSMIKYMGLKESAEFRLDSGALGEEE
jgi:hypothetical protein